MKLIVGLGNPGVKYEKTRHNAGFVVVEWLADKHGLSFSSEGKFFGDIALGNIKKERVAILKPKTFMNESGRAVAAVLNFYKVISDNDIWVVHDDVDLEVGRIKIQIGGGSAGHNGLNSIIESLVSSDFVRFRVGVGRPQNPNIFIEDYVLQNCSGGEAVEECVRAISDSLEKGLEYAKSQNYSRKT